MSNCVPTTTVNSHLKANSRKLLEMNVLIGGSTYSVRVIQLPTEPVVIGIEVRESKGPVEPKEEVVTVSGVTITVSSTPLRITATKNGSVVFSNAVPIGKDYVYESTDGIHMPILINPNEGIYGVGEWFGRVNKVGQRLEVYVVDPGGLPNDRTYVAYPFYWSTAGYGLLVDTHCRVIFDFGSRYLGIGEVVMPRNADMYLIFFNKPSEVIKAFWELTGYPDVPPLWSFGVWYSLWRDTGYMYSTYRTQEDVVKFAEEVRRRGLPGDVIHIDPIYTRRPFRESLRRFLRERLGLSDEEVNEVVKYHEENGRWSFKPAFDYIRSRWPDKFNVILSEYPMTGQGCTFEWHSGFPRPSEMTRRLHELGFRVSIWVNPYAPVGSEWFNELSSRGLLVKVNGEPAVEMPAWVGGSLLSYRYLTRDFGAVDFTNEEACRAYSGRIRELLNIGIDAIKTDYGEGAPENGEYHIGVNPCIHNLYPVIYNEVVYNTIREVKGEAIVWGRSGGLGIHRYPIRWTGDPDSTPRGMAASLRGVLSMATSGIMYSSVDIGGYGGKPSPELYVRWAQMGLLLSHSRFHGVTEREPWSYGDEAYRVVKGYIKLRYALIPYIYSQVIKGLRTGTPLVRPLVMDYPDDEVVRDIDDEYMLGEYLLVAPIFTGESRSVYLPEGYWYDYWDMSIIRGPTTIRVKAPLDKIPIYVKDGAAIPYSRINALSLSSDVLYDLVVETYGNVESFTADFGKYGKVEEVKVTYGEPVKVGDFRVIFVKAQRHVLPN